MESGHLSVFFIRKAKPVSEAPCQHLLKFHGPQLGSMVSPHGEEAGKADILLLLAVWWGGMEGGCGNGCEVRLALVLPQRRCCFLSPVRGLPSASCPCWSLGSQAIGKWDKSPCDNNALHPWIYPIIYRCWNGSKNVHIGQLLSIRG